MNKTKKPHKQKKQKNPTKQKKPQSCQIYMKTFFFPLVVDSETVFSLLHTFTASLAYLYWHCLAAFWVFVVFLISTKLEKGCRKVCITN